MLKINGTIFLNFKIGVHQNDETVSISATYSMKSNMCGSAVEKNPRPELDCGLHLSCHGSQGLRFIRYLL